MNPLLLKLASIVIHYEEWTSKQSDPVDKTAIDSLRQDPEVRAFLDNPSNAVFFPVKRGAR